jgi:hypothetical protein
MTDRSSGTTVTSETYTDSSGQDHLVIRTRGVMSTKDYVQILVYPGYAYSSLISLDYALKAVEAAGYTVTAPTN